jgi:hypothetical protein
LDNIAARKTCMRADPRHAGQPHYRGARAKQPTREAQSGAKTGFFKNNTPFWAGIPNYHGRLANSGNIGV